MEFFKYYKGETKNPYDKKKDYAESWFWHGEYMYYDASLHNPEFHLRSIEYAKSYIKECNEKKISNIMTEDKYTFDQKAIIYYIASLHAKWCPYENGDFIFKY